MAAPQQVEFLAESRDHLTDVCDQLLHLERATGDAARGRVEQMLRAVHSIKGGAGFFGLRTVEQLAHRMETVLEGVLGASRPRDSRMIDVLLAATDRLAALLDDLDNSNAADTSDVVARLDELLAANVLATEVPATQSGDQPTPALSAVSLPASALSNRFEVLVDLSRCQAEGVAPTEVIERVLALGEILQGSVESPEVDLAVSPPRHPVVWRGTIASQLDAGAFQAQLALPGPAPIASLSPESPPAATASAGSSAATPTVGATIRIPVDLVDRLMNLAGELVLVRNQSRRFTDADQPLPGQVIQRLDTVTSEFQATVLQTRMQPVGNLFNKFPRLVRDLSRQLNKQLELRIAGAEVELDKTILDALSDPLTHLVRNACDHGLELPADRQRAGKPPLGTLQLTARHFGDQIWITIEDDGRGIDRDAVRRKALQQGLRTPEELARLDDHDLLGLILLPGFSTAAQVTDVSGRGVGMDVVKTNLARLGGGIDIDSRPGAGTTFTLRLPLTLAIIPTLLVRVDGERYAIPQKDLEELVFVDREQQRVRVEQTPEGELVRLRGRLLPLVRLAQVLQADKRHPEPVVDNTAEPLLFAVVRAGSRRFALVVDSILTSEEIVVKPLHTHLRRLTMYSGATVLGDGRVALILNTEGIAAGARMRFHAEAEASTTNRIETTAERQTVLLVRQINNELLAIPLALVRRIVMVAHERVETLSGGQFVTIDDVPTRLIAPNGDSHAVTGSQPVFIVLPRSFEQAIGFVVSEVIGTEEIADNELHALASDNANGGAAVVGGHITPLADLSRWQGAEQRRRFDIMTASPSTSARVLIVDDTQFFRDVVGRYLSDNGYQVTTAEHGKAALEILARQSFDLVVSDLEMPVMDGWALAVAIRQESKYQRLPLLALTTLAGAAAEAKSLAHGFDGHEVKLDRDSLLARIRQLLESRPRSTASQEGQHG